MTSLSECLIHNKTTFGTNYSNLGKKIGTGLLGRRKVFLAFDSEIGWTLAKLNRFQEILRSTFGLYKETHLKNVQKALENLKTLKKAHNISEPFLEKFGWICHKKNIRGFGTSDSSRADVFAFAEKHGDISFRKAVSHFINANYREGDIILVEGAKANKKVIEKGLPGLDLNKECTIQGWEPQNYKELNGDRLAKYNHREMGKRVFVIAGAAHLFNERHQSHPADTHEIKQTLKQHKNILMTSKDTYKAYDFQRLNRELVSQKVRS